MSVSPQFSFGVTTQNIDDTIYSVFQVVNNPNQPGLVCGNIFLGLQSSIALAIPMGEVLGVARGATVESVPAGFPPSAVIAMVANGNWTAGGVININVCVDDSPRFSSEDGLGEAGSFDPRLAWKSRNGYGPSWRRDFSGVFDHRLEDTGGVPFLDTGLGNSGVFGIRAIVDKREQEAQVFTVPAGPAWSVARVLLEMRRFGAPIGSMEVAIQGSQLDLGGEIEPDGVDLGVSAGVLNATIPLNPASGAITFAFAPDVVLAPGTYWTVIRPLVPYPISVVNFVVWMQRRVFLGPGGSHRTLLGERFDLGLYPGHVDVFLDLTPKAVTGGPIVWNIPAGVAGTLMITPDLSPLVQEVVRNSGHEVTSAMCFTFSTVGETRTFRFAGHAHATRSEPSWSAQFHKRNTHGGLW